MGIHRAQLRRDVVLVCGILVAQAVGLSLLSRPEQSPPARPLAEFPREIGRWRLVQEGVVEDRIREVLKAGDLLNRVYKAPGEPYVSLFIAYFPTQRTGVVPHSPKNCLPGSGWAPVESGRLKLTTPSGALGFEVNRYVVENADHRGVVVYWYQSHARAVASEYWARAYLVWDSLRLRRSDTALVRVVVPADGIGEARATELAMEFAQTVYQILTTHYPQFQPVNAGRSTMGARDQKPKAMPTLNS